MIQLSTLSVPGTLAMPRAPGSPLATASDFALALATISGPAGVTAAAPEPPDAAGVAVIEVGDVRQAIAGGGMILPAAPVSVAPEMTSGDLADAATDDVSVLPQPAIVLPRPVPAIETVRPAVAAVRASPTVAPVESRRPATPPAAMPSLVERAAVATTAEPSSPEAPPADAPKPRKRARPGAIALPIAVEDPVALTVAPIVVPTIAPTPRVAVEPIRPPKQPARDLTAVPVPIETGLATAEPILRPAGDAPAAAKPRPVAVIEPTLIITPAVAPPPPPLATPIALDSPPPASLRASKGQPRTEGEPVAPPPTAVRPDGAPVPMPVSRVAVTPAPPIMSESASEPMPVASVARAGVTTAPLPTAEPGRVSRAIGAEMSVSNDVPAAAQIVPRAPDADRSFTDVKPALPAVAAPAAVSAAWPAPAAVPAFVVRAPTIANDTPAVPTVVTTAIRSEAPPVPAIDGGSAPTVQPSPARMDARSAPVAVPSPAIHADSATPSIAPGAAAREGEAPGAPLPAPTPTPTAPQITLSPAISVQSAPTLARVGTVPRAEAPPPVPDATAPSVAVSPTVAARPIAPHHSAAPAPTARKAASPAPQPPIAVARPVAVPPSTAPADIASPPASAPPAPTSRGAASPAPRPPIIVARPVAVPPTTAPADTVSLPASAPPAIMPAAAAPAAAPAATITLAPALTVVPESAPIAAAVPGKPVDIPVMVTVAPARRTAPPMPAQQPAAQVFAAAMFAADRSPVTVDRDDPAADLAASFPLSGVAPTAAPLAVAAAAAVQQPALDLTRDEWMGSMIDRIETIRDDAGVRETRIRLTPDALGSVDVSIAQDDAGVLQVRFDADTPQARAILAEAAPRLAEMAEARGLKLGGAGVDAGADERRHNAQQPSAPVPARPASAANDDTDSDTDSRIA